MPVSVTRPILKIKNLIEKLQTDTSQKLQLVNK